MFQEVVTLAPDNFRGYSDLGAMNVLLGRYPQAIDLLQKSISIRPTVEVYDNLGMASFLMRKYDEAARNYEEGLKFGKTSWLSWGNLGDAYSQIPEKQQQATRAYLEAIRLADEELRVNPRDGRILSLRATYLAMTNNKPPAMASLQKALSFSPNNPNVEFRAALVYNHFGDTDRTLEWLQKALAAGLPVSLVNQTPDFDHLRADPAFQAILRGAKS
jgi:serine/threonine-protein kinase